MEKRGRNNLRHAGVEGDKINGLFLDAAPVYPSRNGGGDVGSRSHCPRSIRIWKMLVLPPA